MALQVPAQCELSLLHTGLHFHQATNDVKCKAVRSSGTLGSHTAWFARDEWACFKGELMGGRKRKNKLPFLTNQHFPPPLCKEAVCGAGGGL